MIINRFASFVESKPVKHFSWQWNLPRWSRRVFFALTMLGGKCHCRRWLNFNSFQTFMLHLCGGICSFTNSDRNLQDPACLGIRLNIFCTFQGQAKQKLHFESMPEKQRRLMSNFTLLPNTIISPAWLVKWFCSDTFQTTIEGSWPVTELAVVGVTEAKYRVLKMSQKIWTRPSE